MVRTDDIDDPVESHAQQAGVTHEVKHLFGHSLAGQRPQSLAGPACHDDDVSHAVTLARPTLARRGGEPTRATYADGVLILDRLNRRTAIDGASPFLTHYADGQRTELSARSFANWVTKTANLVVDEYALEPGDTVRLTVADAHPMHWMTLIWTMAAWQAGLTVVDEAADLEVAGPEAASASPAGPGGGMAVACSLHPLGLGLVDLPSGWTDFSTAALAQPDDWFGETAADSDLAWDVENDHLSFADLAEVDARAGRSVVSGIRDRWEAVRTCLLAPLLGGGSTLIVAGDPNPAELERIAAAEKADL